jgi:lipopolysaccharide transport system permease protein
MKHFPCAPQEIPKSIWRNRSLINVLIKREVIGRYKGSLLGIVWPFLNAILMLIIYTFVFSVIFKARWVGGSESKVEFAFILFSGLIIFNLFSECLNRSAGLVLSNANYVKKVVFPLEILPIVSLGAALFHLLVSFGIWLIAYIIFYGFPHITLLLMPLVLIPLIFFMLGITWLFSSLAVYVRDIPQFIGVMTTVVMFLSPIFYPADALPENFQKLIAFNPLSTIIEETRKVLFWGQIPNIYRYILCLLQSAAFMFFGFAWFQKTRKGFSDVI